MTVAINGLRKAIARMRSLRPSGIFRLDAGFLQRLLKKGTPFLLCLPLLGCTGTGDREGELVRYFVSCWKTKNRVWVSADQHLFDRFDIVLKSRYQVSFANQRVISATGREFHNCRVFDRTNWTCEDLDGSLLVFKDGSDLVTCSKATHICYLEVNTLNRIMILLRGLNKVNELCAAFSSAFDAELRLPDLRFPAAE